MKQADRAGSIGSVVACSAIVENKDSCTAMLAAGNILNHLALAVQHSISFHVQKLWIERGNSPYPVTPSYINSQFSHPG